MQPMPPQPPPPYGYPPQQPPYYQGGPPPGQAPYPQPPPGGAPKKKPNPALLAVGIGCGALALLAVIGGLVFAFFLKSKVNDFVGGAEDIAQQEQSFQKLNEQYPFTPPADGTPLRLTEARLVEYLSIRESIVPLYKKLSEEAKGLDGKGENLGDGLKAMGLAGGFFRDVRAKYLEGLEQKRMSPSEFHAMTIAIYASHVGQAMAASQQAQKKGLESALATLDKTIAKSAPAMRAQLEAQRNLLQAQLDALPKHAIEPADKAVYDANMALLGRYKARIDDQANAPFDLFLFGSGVDPSDAMGLGLPKR